jgi:hypothetical protein
LPSHLNLDQGDQEGESLIPPSLILIPDIPDIPDIGVILSASPEDILK